MRLIGIDLGTKTMGIAITDSLRIIASGLENFTYQNNDLNICINKIKSLLERYQNDVAGIILGYPTNINGSKNEQTLLVEKFNELLKSQITIPIMLQDERYTTLQATGYLKYQVGLKSSQIKKIKDKMSAVIILDEYLQTHSNF
ncbi:MAG: Holliday junction resolvase RuvX [Mycoplasmataceae bacterium]|jgi:putative Holliday junction resolvase|nr:Holliday junction resolvase RuvX [Mycoplasmataceae bacterium]